MADDWGHVELVRFHVGDSDSDAPIFSDETILGLLRSFDGDVGKTVIACIENIIAQLSMPNFTADWLSIDTKTAREGFQALMNTKRRAFGMANEGRIRPANRRDFLEGS